MNVDDTLRRQEEETPPTPPKSTGKKSTCSKAPRKILKAEEAEEAEEDIPLTMESAISNVLDEFYDKAEDDFSDELMRKVSEFDELTDKSGKNYYILYFILNIICNIICYTVDKKTFMYILENHIFHSLMMLRAKTEVGLIEAVSGLFFDYAEKCVLCTSVIDTFSHNPAPLAESGYCCDDCNNTKVIPARVGWIREDYKRRIAERDAAKAEEDRKQQYVQDQKEAQEKIKRWVRSLDR